jgi:hypothetical protein
MSFNESIVEDAALEWFLLRQGYGGQGWAMRSGTGHTSRRVSHRRSGIRFLRWCWWGACARPSSG